MFKAYSFIVLFTIECRVFRIAMLDEAHDGLTEIVPQVLAASLGHVSNVACESA